MKELAIALLVPVLGGLTWLAYERPEQYERIYGFAAGALLVVQIGIIGSMVGAKFMISDIANASARAAAGVALGDYNLRCFGAMVLVDAAVIYLWALPKLRRFLRSQ